MIKQTQFPDPETSASDAALVPDDSDFRSALRAESELSDDPLAANESDSGLDSEIGNPQSALENLPEDLPGFPVCVLEPPLPRPKPRPRPGEDPSLFTDTRPTRPDDTPFAPPAIRDTYDLPNLYTSEEYYALVGQHHTENDSSDHGRPNSSPDIASTYDQICPDIDTPEYNARPDQLRQAFQRNLHDMPQVPLLRTLEEFEQQAITICRFFQAYPELALLMGDVRAFCCPGQPDYLQTYLQPHERAGNFITPDPMEEDPASINLYLQRARKKTAINMNRLLDRELAGREADPDRVRNLVAFAAIGKYVKQSNPLTGNGPGRPLEPHGKTIQRLHTSPSNWGGPRVGSGPRRKSTDEDELEQE
ncbi:MAG: hypothetical protein ACR2IE_17400 [Candidatus Sumerlaeaceae bacterium]